MSPQPVPIPHWGCRGCSPWHRGWTCSLFGIRQPQGCEGWVPLQPAELRGCLCACSLGAGSPAPHSREEGSTGCLFFFPPVETDVNFFSWTSFCQVEGVLAGLAAPPHLSASLAGSRRRRGFAPTEPSHRANHHPDASPRHQSWLRGATWGWAVLVLPCLLLQGCCSACSAPPRDRAAQAARRCTVSSGGMLRGNEAG